MAVNFFNRYFNITRSKDKVCSTCGGTGHVNVFHPPRPRGCRSTGNVEQYELELNGGTDKQRY